MTSPGLLPADEHNVALLARVHPPDWKNPPPKPLYDLVVIGGGTAGLVAAVGTAGLNGRVALVERHLLGGDCLNFGCVPSKAMLCAARAIYDSQHAKDLGLVENDLHVVPRAGEPHVVDFSAVMARMRRLRAEIGHHDSAQRLTSLGIHLFFGDAHFVSPQSIDVGGQTLRFKRCVIATGGRPAIPDVPGLEEAGFLTNETVFSLTELPPRLTVVGGGPIGCELAQAFRRFGSSVTLIQRGKRLLPKDEPDAAAILDRQFRQEAIDLHYGAKLLRVESVAGAKRLVVTAEGNEQIIEADAILVAVGRVPNVDGLGLKAAGVCYSPRGIETNDYLQTANPRIYAAGDCVGSYLFTHAADAMARICIQNAFFSLGPLGRKRLSDLVIPWTTYTDPEVAHVGLTREAAKPQGIAIDSYREDLSRVDRAVLDGETEGFAMLHCSRGTSRPIGCTIVARHAGEMIGEASILMTARLTMSDLARTIHCYPTQVEVLKRLGDQYNKSRLTPRVAALLKRIIAWRK